MQTLWTKTIFWPIIFTGLENPSHLHSFLNSLGSRAGFYVVGYWLFARSVAPIIKCLINIVKVIAAHPQLWSWLLSQSGWLTHAYALIGYGNGGGEAAPYPCKVKVGTFIWWMCYLKFDLSDLRGAGIRIFAVFSVFNILLFVSFLTKLLLHWMQMWRTSNVWSIMIFRQALKIMSTGLAELVGQEQRGLRSPFSPMQMQSMLGILSRSCKKLGRLWVLRSLAWLVQLVLV